MFTSQIVNTLTYFYPVGNTPAVSLTQSLPSKDPANVLLLGCGDLRNILFTAHVDDRQLDITSCDVQKAIIARNILLLTMIIDDVDAKHDTSIWNIYYQMRLDKKSDDLLHTQATKLVELSGTMETWEQSKYASQLKFCDTATLADVRAMWLFYSSSRGKAHTSTTNKRLDAVVDTANKMKSSQEAGFIITGFRSAAPAHIGSLSDMDTLHKRFWSHGAVDSTSEASKKAKLPNPMFLTVDGVSTLHYGTDSLLGFHLVTAYAPLEPQSPMHITDNGSGQLQKVVDAARLEFRQWTASFRRHAGAITLRFFAGDAIAFAHMLQYACASGRLSAGFYRDRHHFEPLTLLESEYGATGSAPLRFDVVDTSNLCDHVGPLNLLTAASPLLVNKLASTLYTEVIPKATESRKEVLDTMLCGDTPTVSTLLALFPAEYWTNASCVSYGDEDLVKHFVRELQLPGQPVGTSNQGQMFLRVAWKRPPCLGSSSDTTDLSLVPIRFSEQDLAQVLYRIHVRMFEDEDWAKKFASLRLGPSAALQSLNPQPQYHRAGLAAFLRLVQRRVLTDWDKMMELFYDLVVSRPGAPMGLQYFQELCAYLHVLDVHTVDVFKDGSLVPGRNVAPPGGQHLRSWTEIAPVVCITLKVPRRYIKALTEEDKQSFGSPAVHCRVTNGEWENIFSACQFSFGEVSTSGARHSDEFEVRVTEDQQGWNGNSPLIVTFYTSSWGILKDYSSATVSFDLHSTPLILQRFAKHYGPTLIIYETAISNTENVYITKYAVHQKATPSSPGFSVEQMATSGDTNGAATQSLTAGVHPQTGSLVTMTGRLDINCEKQQANLKNGAPVKIDNSTPCHSTVVLGQEQPLDLFFPVPVLAANQKFRIARKSSYIEVVAQVATASSSTEFPTAFVYPLYLTGSGNRVPLTWTMPHLDLQKQPALDTRRVNKMDWLNTHLSQQMSSRERALRDNPSLPRSPGERVRLEFKEGLFSLLVQFAGLQGNKSDIFGISMPQKGGIHILIFPNRLRVDLGTRAVVLDCAVLPLHAVIMPKLAKFLQGTLPLGVVQIKVDEAELSMWKQVIPSWVERCRTDWSHGDGCEYRAAGRIPRTDQHDNTQYLCSCGQGVFPEDFELAGVPGWHSMAKKYSTRAAISPIFWAPFADDAYAPPMGGAGIPMPTPTPTGGCNVCGVKQKKDGKSLMKCGACRLVEYCSAECQKKDWKVHKALCTGRQG